MIRINLFGGPSPGRSFGSFSETFLGPFSVPYRRPDRPVRIHSQQPENIQVCAATRRSATSAYPFMASSLDMPAESGSSGVLVAGGGGIYYGCSRLDTL